MAQSSSRRRPWHLVERDQLVLFALSAALLLVVAVRQIADLRAEADYVRTPAAADRTDYRVDVNRAGSAELELLPGIGPKLAARIIAYRQVHGPFGSPDDLTRVPGISRSLVQKLQGLITLSSAAQGEGAPQ